MGGMGAPKLYNSCIDIRNNQITFWENHFSENGEKTKKGTNNYYSIMQAAGTSFRFYTAKKNIIIRTNFERVFYIFDDEYFFADLFRFYD